LGGFAARRCAQTAQGRGFPLRPIGSTSECAHLRYRRCSFTCRRHVVTSHLITTGPGVYVVTTHCRLATSIVSRDHERHRKFAKFYSGNLIPRYIKPRLCTYVLRYISLNIKKQLIIAAAVNFFQFFIANLLKSFG